MVILIGVVIDIATESILPAPLREYVQAQSNEEWNRQDLMLLCIAIPFLVAVVASYVGLYKLKRWGRSLWLWTGVAGCIFTPAFGPAVYSAWAEPFNFLATAWYGAILALAYASPVARVIEGDPGTQLGNSGVAEGPPSAS